MLRTTPFHPRTSALCTSFRYKDWSGYAAVCRFDGHSEREYYAVRHSAGLLDVTPLYKYEVRGPDAARLLARVMSRDITRFGVGRVTYCCLVDRFGKTLDDCTVGRLGKEHFRMTSSESWFGWLRRHGRGLNVEVEDSTRRIAALALQGPSARAVLDPLVDFDMNRMRFFRVRKMKLAGVDVHISRTGYTGDLGYEVWMDAADALTVWDAIIEEGKPHQIQPIGLDALDVVRIEAGFVLQGVDYFSARNCIIEARKSSVFEVGLGWAVDLEREVPCIGHNALLREAEQGSPWALVGLELDWAHLESLYEEYDVPPHLAPEACRLAVPVYNGRGTQVGQVTSSTWSPLLKRYLALATVRTSFAGTGTQLEVEHTVEYERRRVRANVVDKPFYDPPHKRSTPGAPKKKPEGA
jgi:aminomethyltransferase